MVDTFFVFPVDRLGQGVAERVEQEIALRETSKSKSAGFRFEANAFGDKFGDWRAGRRSGENVGPCNVTQNLP